ncbi:MAG: SH3 domain-containing C40 family peptidase [Bacteroidota bacterium]
MFRILLSLFLATVLLSCGSEPAAVPAAATNLIADLQDYFVPDRRVARLDVELALQDNGALALVGETTLPAAKDSLLEVLAAEGYNEIDDQVLEMPSAALGEETFALARHSVVNLRSEKGHSQELATQVLLGTPLQVLKQDEEWYLARCPDGYLAWVHGGEIVRMTAKELEAWQDADRVVFTANSGFTYSGPTPESEQLGDLVAGGILVREAVRGDYTAVVYPDDRKGFVPNSALQAFDKWLSEHELSFPLTQAIAFQQIGKPYFWGGTSPKAMDCSGFTKTVYWQQGLIIPRDASQQVHAGVAVEYDDELNGLEPGDFLFFGRFREDGSEKITHVGIYLGDGAFTHSGSDNGANKVQQLLPDRPDYVAHRRESLMRARRLQPGGPGIQAVAEHGWYW